MNTIEVSDMEVATTIQTGDLFILQRKMSGTPIPLAVPPALFVLSGEDVGGQSVGWTDSEGNTHTTTLEGMAQTLSFFSVSGGRLCINRSMLSTAPTQDGELYDNGGSLSINYEV